VSLFIVQFRETVTHLMRSCL